MRLDVLFEQHRRELPDGQRALWVHRQLGQVDPELCNT